MHVVNSIYPSEAQIRGFLEPGPDGPIYMVNLLKFKPRAEYPDGRNSELTGAQAYDLYGQAVSVLLNEFGGAVVFEGDVQRLMLGEVEELWDKVAIAMYPSRQAMLAMMQSPRMQEIGIHRAAGLAGQLNIETGSAQRPVDATA
ncbi:MAG: DUF1330 domain-containing protein [Pseudomonadales bacterium]|nr:DUF1330 domain-containing protein [Pseudomonadales bacterium]